MGPAASVSVVVMVVSESKVLRYGSESSRSMSCWLSDSAQTAAGSSVRIKKVVAW